MEGKLSLLYQSLPFFVCKFGWVNTKRARARPYTELGQSYICLSVVGSVQLALCVCLCKCNFVCMCVMHHSKSIDKQLPSLFPLNLFFLSISVTLSLPFPCLLLTQYLTTQSKHSCFSLPFPFPFSLCFPSQTFITYTFLISVQLSNFKCWRQTLYAAISLSSLAITSPCISLSFRLRAHTQMKQKSVSSIGLCISNGPTPTTNEMDQ